MKESLIFGLLFSLLLGNALSQTPTIQINHYNEEPGTQVEIPVEVSNFEEVAAISLFFSYDDELLTFVEYKDPVFSGMVINAFVDIFTGIPQIGITWSETTGDELPDGNLVTIVFDYLSGISDFSFLDKSDIAGVVDGEIVDLDVTYIDGSISPLAEASVIIADVFAAPGIVNVPVTAIGFDNIGAFDFEIDFPTSNVDFEDIVNLLPYLDENGDFEFNQIKAGRLAVNWSLDGDADPLSMADGDILFELQFDFSGGEADISFNVRACEVSDASDDIQPISVEYINGSIKEGVPLGVTVFLEGLYNGSTGQMNKAKDFDPITNSIVDKFPGTIADLITVELHEPGNYGTPAYIIEDIELNQDGSATVGLPPGATGSYYLTIRHRNHLETVSADPIDLSSVNSYDFTDSAGKAFGNNQKLLTTGVFGIYAGDVNQDGLLSGADLVATNTQIRLAAVGYIDTDVNGDGQLTAADLVIINVNVRLAIEAITP